MLGLDLFVACFFLVGLISVGSVDLYFLVVGSGGDYAGDGGEVWI